MRTHYVKKEGPKGALIPGILPSLIYARMDSDTLYTSDSLFHLAVDGVAKESLRVQCNAKEVEKCVKALVADKFLLEIFGTKIEKFLKTA